MNSNHLRFLARVVRAAAAVVAGFIFLAFAGIAFIGWPETPIEFLIWTVALPGLVYLAGDFIGSQFENYATRL